MPDWTKSMQQSFEYYIVDPGTWKDADQIDTVKSSIIERDSDAETKGSASFNINERLGECYIRAYLITIQNGVREKYPLGTFLIQTPSSSFDGMVHTVSMESYTPLLELKENPPPVGYFLPKGSNIMEEAYKIIREHVRAPVVQAKSNEKLYNDFVANTDDKWISFVSDLIANAKFELGLDELGRVLFLPVQDTATLRHIAEFSDGNSSILYSDISEEYDLYGIPNVVEVVYSKNNSNFYVRVVNDDPNSPTSTVSRGREIIYRDSNPEFSGEPTNYQIKEYANKLLQKLSTVEYKITFSHGYYPIRLGDCVLLNYKAAGINNVKAKVIKQSITCETGCKVTETAVYTSKLWG